VSQNETETDPPQRLLHPDVVRRRSLSPAKIARCIRGTVGGSRNLAGGEKTRLSPALAGSAGGGVGVE